MHVHEHDRRGRAQDGVTDPEFDPSLLAFYYARVLRSRRRAGPTIQAKQLGVPPPDVVAASVQERAWSSPIWYTPSARGSQELQPGHHRGRPEKEGRGGPERRAAQGTDRGKVGVAGGTSHGRQIRDPLWCGGQERVGQTGHADRAWVTSPSACVQTKVSSATNTWEEAFTLRAQVGECASASYLATSSPLLHQQREDRTCPSSARRSRSPSTRLGGQYLERAQPTSSRYVQLRDQFPAVTILNRWAGAGSSH